MKTTSIRESSKILNQTDLTVRKHLREGVIKGRKVDGKWVVDLESVEEYKKVLQDRKSRHDQRIQEGSKTINVPPRIRSCNILLKRVSEDETLTPDQSEWVTQLLMRYQGEFVKEYNKKKGR